MYPAEFTRYSDHYPATVHSQALIQFSENSNLFESKLIELQEFKQKLIEGIRMDIDASSLFVEIEQADNIQYKPVPIITKVDQQTVEHLTKSINI